MTARLWEGITPASKADAYVEYLKKTGVRACRETPGNRGVLVLRRVTGDEARFLFLSLWDSMEAVRAFAGPEPEKAVYYPEDADYLIEMAPGVAHHEVLVAPEKL